MKSITLSESTYSALMTLAEANFRTPELQLAYWLSKEGEQIKVSAIGKKAYKTHKRPKSRAANWSPEQRARQSEHMKKLWERGKLGPKSEAMDTAAGQAFDD